MAYYSDLSVYTYLNSDKNDNTLNIGWLDATMPFPKGKVSDTFLDRLWVFCRTPIAVTRGFHVCQFCNMSPNSVPIIQRGNESLKVGYAELRVFGNEDTIYAAPDLVYHYVEKHNYIPPQEFIDAVLKSPLPSSQDYRAKAIKYVWGKELYSTWEIIHEYRIAVKNL